MAYEVELKFVDIDPDALRLTLNNCGAVFKGRHLERNLVFDTAERYFKNNDMLLRLRSKQWKTRTRAVLTMKRPPDANAPEGIAAYDDVKVYDEQETEVSDFSAMQSILEGLGYDAAFRYDKIREEWVLNGAEICLDTLSFGIVVEVEAERETLLQVAQLLGLPLEKSSTGTYHDLNRKWRLENGLEPDDNFAFNSDEIEKITASL